MKKLLPFLLLFLPFLSCEDDEEVHKSVFGKYQLTAVYSDPGDGSGEFQSVESEKIITLYEDSTFQANFSFCNGLSTDPTGNSDGTYTTSFLTFNEDCNNSLPSNELRIDLSESELIISYACIEGCSEKYSRISQ